VRALSVNAGPRPDAGIGRWMAVVDDVNRIPELVETNNETAVPGPDP
jgi:hypothetical protein